MIVKKKQFQKQGILNYQLKTGVTFNKHRTQNHKNSQKPKHLKLDSFITNSKQIKTNKSQSNYYQISSTKIEPINPNQKQTITKNKQITIKLIPHNLHKKIKEPIYPNLKQTISNLITSKTYK